MQLMASKKYKFEVLITPQTEGGFTAEVPDLPGCVSEGDTLEETQKNIEEAIELYLETLQKRGLPLPERESNKVIRMQITVLPSSVDSCSSEKTSHG